jgi:hypothetical protein
MRSHRAIRRVLIVALVPVLVVTLSAATSAYPTVISLPNGFQPEGIAAVNHTFYVGSLVDGDIYRGDLRTGTGTTFADVSGRQALGLKVDTTHHLLFVAGGFTGHAYVYDSRTGADIADYALAPTGMLINDVVVTADAAFFTQTFAPELYRVPIRSDGSLGPAETITVTGPAAVSIPGTFGLNGIDALPDGKTLIVDHSELGALFIVNPRTGASRELSLPPGSLVPTTPDGILRVGHDVWVVETFANTLARVHMAPDWSSGTVTETVTNDAFEVPTTVARHGSRLAAVNAKFDLGFPPPIGPGAPPGTPFEVIQLQP